MIAILYNKYIIDLNYFNTIKKIIKLASTDVRIGNNHINILI
jgi:hypothetical protein